jgi:hypothetical protein
MADLGRTAFATQLFKRSAYSGGRAAGGVNLKDNLRAGDASGTPLEFIYEAADCRMFFTPPMVSDVTALWKGVADRMFAGAAGGNATAAAGMKGCVAGSMGHPSSLSAGAQKRVGDGAGGNGTETATGKSNEATKTPGATPEMATGAGVSVRTSGSGWGVFVVAAAAAAVACL